MKKVYDWNVDLLFKVPKCQKTIQVKGLSVHTFIKELQIQICENLGLNPLSTIMSFYKSGQKEPLKPQTTLYQHKIRNNEMLVCDVNSMMNQVISPAIYMNEQKLFDISEFNKYQPTQQQSLCGLVIKGFCGKKGCLDYNKNRNIALGYGVFDINDIFNHRSCLQCGEKKFIIKDLTISNCCWKYSGRYFSFDGSVRSESKALFEKINALNHSKTIYEAILSRRWAELALMIKQL